MAAHQAMLRHGCGQRHGMALHMPRAFTSHRVPVPVALRSLAFGAPAGRAQSANAEACAPLSASQRPWQHHPPHHHHRGARGGRAAPLSAFNVGDLMLDVPQIDGDIKSLQVEMGATFSDDGIATTFGRKRDALEALGSGVVLADLSHWGRLRLAGEDRLDFMHNQTTASFKDLAPGRGTHTVFVTATGRCLELATALVTPGAVVLLVSPSPVKEALMARMDKYIFPADKVKVQDVSDQTAQLALLGPEAEVVLRELAGEEALSQLGPAPHSHLLVGYRGKPVFVVRGSGLSAPGYTLVMDESVAGDVYAALAAKGAIPMGSEDWEAARVLDGRPAPGAELSEQYNPLEAGLYGAVSLNKGCYIGQETLAKLHLRDGVKQQLWGLRLAGPVEPGAQITSELSKVGVVTSTCQDGDGAWVGLGYIRSRVDGAQLKLEGVQVSVAGMPATVTAIPFATRSFAAGAAPPAPAAAPEGADTIAARAKEAKRKKQEASAEKQEATEAKLKAMQERLAAWQQQQQQTP